MESIEEIERMNVRDLKAFIRRHGYTVTDVPRLDGSVGPPKKADLLRASKEIWHDRKQAQLELSTPPRPTTKSNQQQQVINSNVIESPENNPFQQQRILSSSPSSTPAKRRISNSISTLTNKNNNNSNNNLTNTQQPLITAFTNTATSSSTSNIQPSPPPPPSPQPPPPPKPTVQQQERTTVPTVAPITTTTASTITTATAATAALKPPAMAPPPSQQQQPPPPQQRRAHMAINPQFAHLFASPAQQQPSRPSLTPVSRRSIIPDNNISANARPPTSANTNTNNNSNSVRRATVAAAPQVVPTAPTQRPPIATPQPKQQQQQQQQTISNTNTNVNNNTTRQSTPAMVPTPTATSVTASALARRATLAASRPTPSKSSYSSVPTPIASSTTTAAVAAAVAAAAVTPTSTLAQPTRVADIAPPSIRKSLPQTTTVVADDNNDDGTNDDGVMDMEIDHDLSASEVDSIADSGMGDGNGSSTAGDSDASVVETDEDNDDPNDGDMFSRMDVSHIRAWLTRNKVKHSSNDVVQLRSLARGHKMYLDSTADVVDVDAPNQQNDQNNRRTLRKRKSSARNAVDDEEIQPVSNSSSTASASLSSRKSRQTTSSSTVVLDDDGDDVDDIPFGEDDVMYVAAKQHRKPRLKKSKSSRKRSSNRPSQLRPPPLRNASSMKQFNVVIFIALAAFSVTALASALHSLYVNTTMPYCDSPIPSSYYQTSDINTSSSSSTALKTNNNSTGGDEQRCRPCPKHGSCSDGTLTCSPGYALVDGRCAEDQEFSLYAQTLASDAIHLLRDMAGQAECGTRRSRSLTASEIRDVLRESESSLYKATKRGGKRRSSSSSLFSFLRRSKTRPDVYDASKFEPAMSLALRLLTDVNDDDEASPIFEEISLSSEGEYTSSIAAIPFSCRVRKFLLANLGRVLLVITVLSVAIYLRVKLELRRRYWRTVDSWYALALDELREHKAGFEDGVESLAFIKDVVLRAEIVGRVTTRAIKTWKDVEKRLNDDPRVLRGSRTVAGVPSYTYEWQGRRRSGSIGEGLSRRSSFGSRTSLDSLDMSSSAGGLEDSTSARNSLGLNMTPSSFRFWSDRED